MINPVFLQSLTFKLATPDAKAAWISLVGLTHDQEGDGSNIPHVKQSVTRLLSIAGITDQHLTAAIQAGLCSWSGESLSLIGCGSGCGIAQHIEHTQFSEGAQVQEAPHIKVKQSLDSHLKPERKKYTLSPEALAARSRGGKARYQQILLNSAKSKPIFAEIPTKTLADSAVLASDLAVSSSYAIKNKTTSTSFLSLNKNTDTGFRTYGDLAKTDNKNFQLNSSVKQQKDLAEKVSPELVATSIVKAESIIQPHTDKYGRILGFNPDAMKAAYNAKDMMGLLRAFHVEMTRRENGVRVDFTSEWINVVADMDVREVTGVFLWMALKRDIPRLPSGFRNARRKFDQLDEQDYCQLLIQLHSEYNYPISDGIKNKTIIKSSKLPA